MKKNIRRVLAVALFSVIAVYGVCLASFWFAYDKEAEGLNITTCISPSMEPNIMTNGWVVTDRTVPFEDIEKGDIVMVDVGKGRYVNHRVHQVSYATGEKTLLTVGDNMLNIVDAWAVSEDEFIGEVVNYTNMPVLFNNILCGDILKESNGRFVLGVIMILGIISTPLALWFWEEVKCFFSNLYRRIRRVIQMEDKKIWMETTHGRRGKCKTEFKGVVSKILVSSMALAIAVGSLPMSTFAANIPDTNTNSPVVMADYINKADAITEMANTVKALEELKLKGAVTNEGLRSLASCIYSLERAGQGTDEVKVLLDRAENILDGLNLSEVGNVQIAIQIARDSLFGHTVQNRAAAVTSFPDVKKGSWYYDTVMKMTNAGIINGFPDGTFKPENTISYAEYIALLVRTTGAKSTHIEEEGDVWYAGAVAAAYENHIIKTGEVFDFTQPISRVEAAMFTERAVQEVLGEDSLNTTNIDKLINDFSKIDGTKFEYYVLQQYARGIFVGDGAGNFAGDSNLTRAQAATLINRTTDIAARRDMGEVDLNDSIPQTGSGVIEEGPYAGRMKIDASTELDLQALSTARFYKENGKLYVSITLPELPDGFKWQWGIKAYDKNDEYVFGTYRSQTLGKTGKQTIEVYSMYDGKTVNDIVVTTLSVSVVNENNQSMVSHKLSTDAKGQVLRQSSVDSSNASWERFNTTNIFNW